LFPVFRPSTRFESITVFTYFCGRPPSPVPFFPRARHHVLRVAPRTCCPRAIFRQPTLRESVAPPTGTFFFRAPHPESSSRTCRRVAGGVFLSPSSFFPIHREKVAKGGSIHAIFTRSMFAFRRPARSGLGTFRRAVLCFFELGRESAKIYIFSSLFFFFEPSALYIGSRKICKTALGFFPPVPFFSDLCFRQANTHRFVFMDPRALSAHPTDSPLLAPMFGPFSSSSPKVPGTPKPFSP